MSKNISENTKKIIIETRKDLSEFSVDEYAVDEHGEYECINTISMGSVEEVYAWLKENIPDDWWEKKE